MGHVAVSSVVPGSSGLLSDMAYMRTMAALEADPTTKAFHIVPVSGLVIAYFTVLEQELKTVLEMYTRASADPEQSESIFGGEHGEEKKGSEFPVGVPFGLGMAEAVALPDGTSGTHAEVERVPPAPPLLPLPGPSREVLPPRESRELPLPGPSREVLPPREPREAKEPAAPAERVNRAAALTAPPKLRVRSDSHDDIDELRSKTIVGRGRGTRAPTRPSLRPGFTPLTPQVIELNRLQDPAALRKSGLPL